MKHLLTLILPHLKKSQHHFIENKIEKYTDRNQNLKVINFKLTRHTEVLNTSC